MGSEAVLGITLAVATLVASACSKGDDDGGTMGTSAPPSSEQGSTTLAPCAENPHVAVFDIFGTLTPDANDVITWINTEEPPDARPYAASVAAAYKQRGYQILYVTGLPSSTLLDGKPAPDALTEWLDNHDFPTGDGARIELTETGDFKTEMSRDLTSLAGTGVKIDAAYTDNDSDLEVYILSGAQQVYKLGAATTESRSTLVPNDDMQAQLKVVEALPAVCS
jgi:hypothetical protein